MFRTEAVRAIGGYREEYLTCEDMDLYLRLAEIGRLANLPDILLLYRQRLGSINRTHRLFQDQDGSKVLRDARKRRGLPLGQEFLDRNPVSIQPDNDHENWADLSHSAFAGGYLKTARQYAWRAIRAQPLALSSWKAVLREYFRDVPSRPGAASEIDLLAGNKIRLCSPEATVREVNRRE
jgi:hypothetical protein